MQDSIERRNSHMNKIYKNVKRTIKIASWPFLLSFIGSIIAATANMGIMLLISSIISNLTNQALNNAFDMQALINLFYIFLMTLPVYFIGMMCSLTGGMKATQNFRQTIMDSSMKHHEQYVKDGHSASIMAVMTSDTYKIEDFFYQLLNYGIMHPIVHGIIALTLLITQNLVLATVSVIIGVITVFISSRFSTKVQEADAQSRLLMETSTKTLSEIIANDDMIRMLNIKEEVLEEYFEENTKYSNKLTEAQVLKTKISTFNNVITVLSRTIFLAYGIYLFTLGSLNFGIIFILIPLQGSVSRFFSSLSSSYNILVEVSNASERAFDIIDLPKEDERSNKSDLVYTQEDTIISLSHVNFAYPNTKPLFHDLNIDIQKNSTVAFVGESGSGKSTIFQLLLGFFEINKGTLKIGNDDVSEHSLKSIREHFVYIEQSAPLFNKTIKENIRLGSKHNPSDEDIIEAAKKANIHDFIMTLENGYNTEVSASENMLSGGQRQRIVIARAFMSDAPIIVMDEPTSALDNESELHIQNALDTLKGERTVLIAAHRLSTIEDADKIYVLKDGVIIEEGTHTQLINNKDYYYKLNKTQEAL